MESLTGETSTLPHVSRHQGRGARGRRRGGGGGEGAPSGSRGVDAAVRRRGGAGRSPVGPRRGRVAARGGACARGPATGRGGQCTVWVGGVGKANREGWIPLPRPLAATGSAPTSKVWR